MSVSVTTAYMAEILLSSPMPHWEHMSLSIPHCIHARDPPLLYHPPLGTYVSECYHCVHGRDPPFLSHPPLRTCVTEHPSLVYMAELLLSSTIPHWELMSVSVPHCVHARDPPLLSHPPLGTCVTESPPLRTWQRSSSLPSPSKDM